MRPESSSRMAINRKIDNDVKFADMTSLSNFFWRCFVSLVNFSYWSKYHVNIITVSGVTTIFLRDWLEIRKLEIPPSKFYPIYGDWSELGMPNLAQMPLIKSYWMQQNAKVSALIVSELLRENQKEVKLLPTQG